MRYNAKEMAEALGGATKLSDGSWKCQCPSHRDDTASLGLRDKGGKLLLKCYGGCSQEQVIEELKRRDLWSVSSSGQGKASWEPITPVPDGVSPPKSFTHTTLGEPARTWTYRDLDNKVVGYVCRFEQVVDGKVKKTPMPMSWCQSDDGRKDWRWKSFAKPRPMYGLEKLAARPKDRVLLLEGEKACDAAQVLFPDYVCVSWAGGTKAVRFVDFKPLAGREVSLWPDADDVGRKAMATAAEILFVDGAAKVSVVPVPEWVDTYRAPGEADTDKPSGQGWDVADELLPGMEQYRAMLDAAGNFEPEGGNVVEQLNRRYAFVLVGGKSAVLRETKDPETGKTELAYLSPDAFAQFHCNNLVPVGKDLVPAGKYWMTHESRRTYEGITFAPGRKLNNYYNLWRGFAFEPDPEGNWSMFREHLLKNAAQGDEEHFTWILSWFAQIFQSPARKSDTSLAFRGKQGTGKTVVGKIFGKLMPQHYTLVSDSRYLFGNFNSHLASTILLHSDESFWGGDHRNVGKLKAMVSGDTHYIENKRMDPVEIPNFMRLLMTTNDDWVVPAASEERRFAVFDMGDGNMQDKSYFVHMQRQMRDGGYAGLLHHLLTMDLTQVDVGKIPNTEALRDQKETSLGDVAKFWLYCLTEGEILPEHGKAWEATVMSRKLYESCLTHLESLGTRYRPTPAQFTRDLAKLVPGGGLEDIKIQVSGRSCWAYKLPDLEVARKFFDDVYGAKFQWKREPSKVLADADPEIPF